MGILSVQVSHSVMSDSLRPHGLQPTRLLRPWNFPGKNYWSGVPLPSPLCLLDGTFNPFTFKVIIDIYVPIALFLIVWSLIL